MMFNNISTLAHSLEDLFFFIRESKEVTIDFGNLFDLVLCGIDFIKGEVVKIQNEEEADGSSEKLVLKSKSTLEEVKKVNGDNGNKESTKPIEETKYYISSYESSEKNGEEKFTARIFYEDGCEMENVRAYTVVHNLKNIASEIYHIPEDVIENNDSVDYIRKNGFLIGFSTSIGAEKAEEQLNETIFLRDLDFKKVDEYPSEITDLFKKTEIILEEPVEEITTNIVEGERIAKNGKQQSIISVNTSKLDMLLDLVGEIVISEAMVTKNPDLNGLQLDNFNKASRQLRKLTNELQDVVMSIRMVPVSITFHKMNRIVRDISKKLNKEVELQIIGEETEVDKNIIDHISDPLMHLVRNSLDHGLEDNEERLTLGKPKIGKITLEAKNAGGDVFIIEIGRASCRERV